MSDARRRWPSAAGVAPRWRDCAANEHEVGARHAARGARRARACRPARDGRDRATAAPARRAGARRPAAAGHRRVGEPTGCRDAAAAFELALEDGTRPIGRRERGAAARCRRSSSPAITGSRSAAQRRRSRSRRARCHDRAARAAPWALAVQLYALRRNGDGGLGDFAALRGLRARAPPRTAPPRSRSARCTRSSPPTPTASAPTRRPAASCSTCCTRAAGRSDAERRGSRRWTWWTGRPRPRRGSRALRDAFERPRPPSARRSPRSAPSRASALETHARFEALHAAAVRRRPAAGTGALAGGAARPGQPGRRRVRARPRRRGRASTPTCSSAPTAASRRRRRRRATRACRSA